MEKPRRGMGFTWILENVFGLNADDVRQLVSSWRNPLHLRENDEMKVNPPASSINFEWAPW